MTVVRGTGDSCHEERVKPSSFLQVESIGKKILSQGEDLIS